MWELPTRISNMAHHALFQSLKVLVTMSVSRNSQNEELGGVEEKQDRLLEEANNYKMVKEKLEMTLLGKTVAMKR